MRIHLISDLHGAAWHLAEAGKGCDALLVLGDLINVLDYHSMEGILVDLFGREHVAEAAGLRQRGRYAEARAVMRQSPLDEDEFRERFVELAREEYERVFDAMPDNSFVTFGNVDIPELLRTFIRPGITFVDAEVLELDGERVGMVGGGLRTPLGIPGEVEEEEYDRKLEAVGPADVICTHQPPRIPWLVYDVLGKRFEPGSTGLVGYIRRHRPRRAYFGHVHQPLVNRMIAYDTEMVNVGHFRATGQPYV
ncbi:MAG: metallophosphoesterase, partial [Actinomycetota bacterium]|nr:metallophosphoesterase [Actinomycetota bacterium]